MPRSILVTTEAVTTRPRAGQPVRANELVLEFDVTVDEEACYAIDVRWIEEDSFSDDVFLQNHDAFVPCHCLAAGTHRFRIGAASAAPAGATMPPAPAAGTILLPPVEGSWPADDGWFDTDIEIFYEISVYRIGPCDPARHCEQVQRTALIAKWMELEGPRKADGTRGTIERTVIAVETPSTTRVAAADSHRLGDPSPAFVLGAVAAKAGARLRVVDGDVAFDLTREPARRGEPATVRVDVLANRATGLEPAGMMHVLDVRSLQALGRDLIAIRAADRKRDRATMARLSGRVVRHGLVLDN